MRCLISADLVAAKLSRSLTWFNKHKNRLTAENNFPKPITAIGNVWDETAIDIWIEAQNSARAYQSVDDDERRRVKSSISERIAKVFPLSVAK